MTGCPECSEGWGLLGKQPLYKEQVAFSRSLGTCLCREGSASLKGLVSEHSVSVPLVEWRGPRTKETHSSFHNDICLLCFPEGVLQGACSARLSEMGVWSLARGSGRRKVLKERLSSLLPKVDSSLWHSLFISAEPTLPSSCFIQIPQLSGFPAVSF